MAKKNSIPTERKESVARESVSHITGPEKASIPSRGRRILFFTLPAYGHVYPTLEMVRALVSQGYQVRYYSFAAFRGLVEETGAEYVECDAYLPPSHEDLTEKIERDFGTLVEMVCDTTVNMNDMIQQEMKEYQPDLIMAETMCFWGKLFAYRFHVPYICIVPGFANNVYTEKLKKLDWNRFLTLEFEMPRINTKLELLRAYGYRVRGYSGLSQNDAYTNTIVCTARGLQPRADTFSKNYAFVGPCLPAQDRKGQDPKGREGKETGREKEQAKETAKATEKGKGKGQRKRILVSLNLPDTRRDRFYRDCMTVFQGMDLEVILSVPSSFDKTKYGQIPANVRIRQNVNPAEVLPECDLFFCKCAVSEMNQSLYFGVPMLLYPMQTDEKLAAMQAEKLGAGLQLKKLKTEEIRAGIRTMLDTPAYRENAVRLQAELAACGGVREAVAFVERVIEKKDGYIRAL